MPEPPLERWRITLRGRVQGVGMRPYLSRLASEFQLVGVVYNQSASVVAEVQGSPRNLASFRAAAGRGPSGSRIDDMAMQPIGLTSDTSFTIVSSTQIWAGSIHVPPDVAPCAECIKECFDPSDRRYLYPFISCSTCGPRFTIIESLPFDRATTSMRDFPLCHACDREYHDPTDRRFHTQSIACPECGPQLNWKDTSGNHLQKEAALTEAIASLVRGEIVAIQGVGGYHLVCDATNDEVVQKLRLRKERGGKPFALLASSFAMIRAYTECDDEEAELLLGLQRPILLLKRRESSHAIPLSSAVAPGMKTLGFVLPSCPIHELLPRDRPWVLTSANISGDPLIFENDEKSTANLLSLADGILAHNRRIIARCDDSVLQMTDGASVFVRRSRGFVPESIAIPETGPIVLALGGELKATIALAIGDRVYMGPHVGDLGSWNSLEALNDSIEHFLKLFRVQPEVIACDAHPGYLSHEWASRYAMERNIPLRRIFHHYAHAAAWQSDTSSYEQPSLVACFDGTGYGPNGTIWGGEFFIVNQRAISHVAHWKSVPLLGGERAIEQPSRMALSYLWSCGLEWSEQLPPVAVFPPLQRDRLKKQLEQGINCPQTSSVGRMFDAVAALLGIHQSVSYEGQAAVELEAIAIATPDAYSFNLSDDEPGVLDASNMFGEIIGDLQRGIAVPYIAGKFHRTIANSIIHVARRVRKQHGIHRVGLTGGVFQNQFLVYLLFCELANEGLELSIHRQVPCHDGGLALGQAWLVRQDSRNGCVWHA